MGKIKHYKALFFISFSLSGFVVDDILDIYYKQEWTPPQNVLGENKNPVHYSRSYYDALVNKRLKKRWSIPFKFNYIFSDSAFDAQGQRITLSQSLAGKDLTIADVSLFCKLSANNKIRILNRPALGFDRGADPVTATVPFGSYRDDLFSTLIAPVKIELGADTQVFEYNTAALYRFWFGKEERCSITAGLVMPVKSVKVVLNPSFLGGSLYRDTRFSTAVTQREDQLKQFFREYSSIEDFFIRGVLGKKHIAFNKSAQKVGIGDICLFSLIDYKKLFSRITHTIQTGVMLTMPTGGCIDQSSLYAPHLGDGAWKGALFAHIVCNTTTELFNPFVRGCVEISGPMSYKGGGVRVPTYVVQDKLRVQASSIPELQTLDIFLSNFTSYWVDSFAEYDSTSALFADKPTQGLSVSRGTHYSIGFGNYMYNIAHTNAKLTMMYRYMYRQPTKVTGNTDAFDAHALIKNSSMQAHMFSWNIEFPGKVVNLFVGSEHTFAGHNVIRNNTLFISGTIAF